MYIQYNPNPVGKSTGDCVIRALTKPLNKPWDQVYIELCVEGYILGDMPSSNSVWSAYLKHHGFIKNLIPNSCPDCYTVRDFANDNHNMFIYKGEIIMAYTPTNWKDGDIISAEKMNKLEQGVAEGGDGGVLLVNVTKSGGSTPVVNSASPMLNAIPSSTTFIADKTYAEVDAAVKAGKMVYLVYDSNFMPLSLFDSENDSIVYVFEKINNYKHLKYMGGYTSNELQFKEYPYFTTIFATYTGGSYDRVHPLHGDDVTMFDIYDMLNNDGVKVDLVVQGKETADLILPLSSIDSDSNYAYFSNNSLTLKVDANGAVTEFQPTP